MTQEQADELFEWIQDLNAEQLSLLWRWLYAQYGRRVEHEWRGETPPRLRNPHR